MTKLAVEMTAQEMDELIARQVLAPEEQEIEDGLKAGRFKRDDRFEERMQAWREALENTDRKTPISLRVSSRIINRLKLKARDQGIPYQTLINSILHKYVNGRFAERD